MEFLRELPLKDRPIEELTELLAKLENRERHLLNLRERHPKIAALANDKGLNRSQYQLWQVIVGEFAGLNHRLSNIRQIIEDGFD